MVANEPRALLSRQEELSALSNSALEARPSAGPIRILEAGCGQHWTLDLGDVPLHITGVDSDREALRIRRETYNDLDEEIHGDLRSVNLPKASFDLVYCSFVLEHVSGAEAVLDRLASALKPGGRMIVRIPDGESVYGFITKHSPHRLHVYYKRYVQRNREAGKPGHPPYPTFYDRVISISGFRGWADRTGLVIEDEYVTNFYVNMFGPFRPVVKLVVRLIAAFSSGRLSATHNNVTFVLSKP